MGKPNKTVQTAAVLAITLPLVSGCQKAMKDRLQGNWRGESVENVPAGQVVQATGWAKGTRFEFQGSKVKVRLPAEEPRNGSFQVVRQEGDRVVVAFTREDGLGRDEAVFRFVGDRTMRWDVGGGREVVLSREDRGL